MHCPRRRNVNAIERDLGTCVRFLAKIASRDITSIMAEGGIPLNKKFSRLVGLYPVSMSLFFFFDLITI